MGFKKHNWIRYSHGNEIVEITIKGDRGGKIDSFRCNNGKDYRRILGIIKDKYGFDFKPEISPNESINARKEKKEEIEKERSWLDKDLDWNTSNI